MPLVVSTVVIPCTPARVWPLISTPAGFARWQTTHLGFRGEVPAVLAEGAGFVEQVRVMGMPAGVAWIVDQVVPGSSVAMTGRGPLGISLHSTIGLEPADAGSVVRLSREAGGSALAALGDQLEHELRTEQERSLARLREVAASDSAG